MVNADGSTKTLAGSGVAGHADGVGTAALFNRPVGIAQHDGGFVISDSHNHRIRKLALDGTVVTIAGSGVRGFADGKGSDAAFNCPFGISVDGAGVAVVADLGNDRLRSVQLSTGRVATLAGGGGGGLGGSAAVGGSGGGSSASPPPLQSSGPRADGGAAPERLFARPYVCAVTTEGKVLMAEMEGRQIKMVTPAEGNKLVSPPGFSAGSTAYAADAGAKLLRDLLSTGTHADVTFRFATGSSAAHADNAGSGGSVPSSGGGGGGGGSSSGGGGAIEAGAAAAAAVVTAHRSVLTLRSEYFAAMFENARFAEADGVVQLPEGVSELAVRATLQFLYTSDLAALERCTNVELEQTLKLAQEWLLDELVEQCCNLFVSRLEPANCIATMLLADSLLGEEHKDVGELKANAISFAAQTFLQIPNGHVEHLARTNPTLLVDMLRVLSIQKAGGQAAAAAAAATGRTSP